MSLTGPERETIVTLNDEDETAHIWTAQRPIITKLKGNPSAVLLNEGQHGKSVWAEFELPKGLVSFRSKSKAGSEMSEAQRRAAREGAARLAHVRATANN